MTIASDLRHAICTSAVLLMLASAAHADEAVNVALRRPYTLDPAPNYSGGTSKTGALVLTDGKVTQRGTLWVQPSAVGWTHVRPVTITIDLGDVVAIDHVTWHAAAGTADVEWPESILAFGSADGKSFSLLGDLVALDAALGGRPPMGHYSEYTFAGHFSSAAIRFLRLMADPRGPYLFVDEIQVFRATRAAAAHPASVATVDTGAEFWRTHAAASARDAIRADLDRVRARLASLDLPPDTHRQFEDRAAKAASRAISSVRAFLTDRPTLPIGPDHASLYAALGAAEMRAGRAALQAWPTNPWAPLAPEEVPVGSVPQQVIIGAMRGERRSGTINIRNATSQPQEVSLSATIEGIAGEQLSLAPELWTGTEQSGWVSAKIGAATSHLRVPAGVTQQIWITFDAGNAAPGLHAGAITVRAADNSVRVPVVLRVFATQFPAHPAVLVQGWDYLQDPGSNAITAANIDAVAPFLRSQGVNVAWATRTVFDFGHYDSAGHLASRPSTSTLDHWLARWPNAARYRVFVAAQGDIAGIPSDDPRFPVAVKEWAKYWAEALEKRGHAPQTVELHLIDEPRNGAQGRTELAWEQALRRSGSGLRIWVNPNWPDPADIPRELIDLADVVCINLSIANSAGASYWHWAQQLAAAGKAVEVYGTDGPASSLDPYAYYRTAFWRAHSIGAVGVGFWSFSDTGGGESSDEFADRAIDYVPYYLDSAGVARGKHMEALSEGARDYEYLRLLAMVAEKSSRPQERSEAASLLSQAVAAVIASVGTFNASWTTARDRSVADAWRFRIGMFLERIDLSHL